MNGSQKAVLWIGLILIAFNVVMKWSSVKSVIFGGPSATGGGSSSPASPSKGPSVTIPIDPFLPVSPHITIPLSQPVNSTPTHITTV